MPKFMDSLPEWLESRKLAWGVMTVVVVSLLAVLGTVLAWLGDVPTGLFEQAMYLVTGAGAGGAGSQAVVDTARVRANPDASRTWRTSTPVYSAPTDQETPEERSTPPSIFGR
jgi:hypothetical protein